MGAGMVAGKKSGLLSLKFQTWGANVEAMPSHIEYETGLGHAYWPGPRLIGEGFS